MKRSNRARTARVLAGSAALTLVVCALPAVAGAADYCVAPNPSCPAANTYQHFEDALAKADDATDADRILLGEGTYEAPTASGFGYNQPSSPVEIVGQGEDRTTVTSPPGGSLWVMRLVGGPGSSIHDLTIRLPQSAAGGIIALSTANTARRIQVTEDQIETNWRRGVELLDGATLEDSRVSLAPGNTTAVYLKSGGGTVRDSALSGWWGVWSVGGGTIERSRVTASGTGVAANRGITTVARSLIRMTGADSVGLSAGPDAAFDVTLNADGVTIIGPGLPQTDGADLFTHFAPSQNARLNLTNSIIRGMSNAMRADAVGSGTATIAASYSDYDPSGNSHSGAGSIDEANVSNVGDAGFADPAGGDFHLLPTSALVDRGDPSAAQGLDLDGNPLVADGNGDGKARRDLGAFELQPSPAAGQGGPPPADTQAPLVSAFGASPSRFAVAHGTRFRYSLSEDARVTLTIRRELPGRRQGGKCVRPTRRLQRAKRCTRYRAIGSLVRSARSGANSTRFTGRLGRRALRPGRYSAVITASDAAGNRSAPRRARFRIVRR